MRKVSVMNRAQAEAFEFPDNISVISITRKGSARANIKGGRLVLFQFFDDNDYDFSIKQAKAILDFVRVAKGDIVVHCDNGISRSAGVAAALEATGFLWVKLDGKLWIAGSGWEDRYEPNLHVKGTILKEYERRDDT